MEIHELALTAFHSPANEVMLYLFFLIIIIVR